MQTLIDKQSSSSILVIGPLKVAMGSDQVSTLEEAKNLFNLHNYDILVVDFQMLQADEFITFFKNLKKTSLQLVVYGDVSDKNLLLYFYNKFKIAGVIDGNPDPIIISALEKSQFEKQNSELEFLIKSQSEKLRQLYQELEVRVVKRQRSLEESRRKTALASARWETLREAMISIHKARSVSEIEVFLFSSLNVTLQLESIRIFYHPQDKLFLEQNKNKLPFSVFKSKLYKEQKPIGSIFFLREIQRPFNKEESDFLSRVSEAVSLALDRLSHIEQSENLKEQWQATFNAISDPVLLISEKYEVIQANEAALKRNPQKSFLNTKCYQLLFEKSLPCQHCQFGKKFRLDYKSEIYDVFSQKLENHYIHFYHDISEKIRMERKIIESAKLAEVGTIGSSIAHELNNPLGGILSFIQLIRMDLKPEDPLYPDIAEMESGVKRCRDIIENLLGFTRNPESDVFKIIDLKEAISRAIKIVELQTKARNIEIRLLVPQGKALVSAHLNLISQAIKSLLQLSIEAVGGVEGLGIIEISLESMKEQWFLKIIDNGPGESRRNSLQFSISAQIIHEHGGMLDLFAQPRQMTMVKISLPRKDF